MEIQPTKISPKTKKLKGATKSEKSCGAVVFRRQGVNENSVVYLLIQQRLGRHWDFPKGHVEQGETECQTALREVQEETGMEVSLLDGFREMISYSTPKGNHKTVVHFLGEAENDEVIVQTDEIGSYVWLPFEEAIEKVTYENARNVITRAHEFLQRHLQNTSER